MSEIPFNTTPVPKTFDLFADDLKRNLDDYEEDHLASSTRSFKQLNTKPTTNSTKNQPNKETTNLAKFKSSLKILTSSIDKDLNMIKPPLPPQPHQPQPAISIVNNKNTDNFLETDEPRVVFNKTYTSWPMEDQKAQLNAFNSNDEDDSEINNRTININTKKTSNNDNLNLTQDIIVQDLDDMMDVDPNDDDENNNNRKQDLNLTREILTSSSSAISSVGSSLPSSKSASRYSSMNNIPQKQNLVKNNNNIERVLNRTRSINEDSDSEVHNVTIDKGSEASNNSNNKRKSIYNKPVIDPVEPPTKSTQQSKLVQMYKNKPVSNLAKPSLLVNYTSKSLDSHKLPDAATKKSTLNTLMNTTTVIETNDEPNINKQTNSKLKHTSGISSKQSKLPSPVKPNTKSPVQTTNLPKFSQQQPTITKQLSVQKTTDTKSSLIPSPNSNRLSSASSTSSSSSLKENKKISPPTTSTKSPIYSSTSKLKTIGLSNINTANNKTTHLNNINNQQQQQQQPASKLKTIQLTSLPRPSLMTNQIKTSSIPMPGSGISASNLLQQKYLDLIFKFSK